MSVDISTDDIREIIRLIKLQYGYDFSNYAPASFKRRLLKFMQTADTGIYDFKYNIINDRSFFFWLLGSLTVNVTEMFRDPSFYKAVREEVLPVLATYPLIKIWHAGCATGEEAFSMAILLHEAGLLKRTKIYATDVNMANIERATSGIISLDHMKDYTINYQNSGGNNDFANYYTARYGNAIINKEIRKNILFSQHNLATDHVFNEFQLICCRNVLIYFNKPLQNNVLTLFYHSLSPLGFLALGTKESLLFSDNRNKFDVVNAKNKIYRLKLPGK